MNDNLTKVADLQITQLKSIWLTRLGPVIGFVRSRKFVVCRQPYFEVFSGVFA